jgi:hypothetical protein
MPESSKMCEWFDCGSIAEKRVNFGLRILDIPLEQPLWEIQYTSQESLLCAPHAERVRLSYAHFSEEPLV